MNTQPNTKPVEVEVFAVYVDFLTDHCTFSHFETAEGEVVEQM